MVYELVWKNQRLNCFTHACNGIDTHMHEKFHTLLHIRTYANDSVAVTEHTSSPLPLLGLSREKVVVAIRQRIQVFLFGSLHMQAKIYITYLHQCTYTGSLTHRRINRKQPKQTLDYTSHCSSRESHQSI